MLRNDDPKDDPDITALNGYCTGLILTKAGKLDQIESQKTQNCTLSEYLYRENTKKRTFGKY